MNPKAIALQQRTHKFFMNIVKLCEALPDNDVVFSIRPQLLDSAGSTDSNYRSACRGRSHNEFIAKIAVAAEEADESKGWLEGLLDAGYGDRQVTRALIREADELTAIFVKSHKTAKKRQAAAAAANGASNHQSSIRQSPILNPQSINPQSAIANRQSSVSATCPSVPEAFFIR